MKKFGMNHAISVWWLDSWRELTLIRFLNNISSRASWTILDWTPYQNKSYMNVIRLIPMAHIGFPLHRLFLLSHLSHLFSYKSFLLFSSFSFHYFCFQLNFVLRCFFCWCVTFFMRIVRCPPIMSFTVLFVSIGIYLR